VLILTAVLLSLPNAAQAQVELLSAAGQIETIECPTAVPKDITIECGILLVPENYDVPDGATIRLPYIILRSPNPNPAPDPLLFTVGGPGYSSLDTLWGFVNSPILADRDVIIFEQRGNQFAEPSLVCEKPIWHEEASQQTPCLDFIRAHGIDLSQYTIQNITRDLISLRQTLGFEQWNLYGTSFSTSPMLLMMQADAQAVRSVILQSVNPPHITTFDHEADSGLRAIQQLFDDCTADPHCSSAYPLLETQFYALVEDLNQSPLQFKLWSWAAVDYIPVTFSGDNLIGWLMIDSFYRPTFPPFDTAHLPLLISEASHGNMAALEAAAQGFWSTSMEDPHWALGLLLAISCQQDLPAASSPRPVADLAASEKLGGFTRNAELRAICAAWDLAPQPLPADDFIQSDIPTLVLSGSYDPVTPPAWSQATAGHLSKSTYVQFPGQGHNVTVSNPCAAALQGNFLRNPQAVLDTSCVDEEAGPAFVMREDLFMAPGLALSTNDLEIGGQRGETWIEIWWSVSFLFLAISLVILLAGGLFWLVRGRQRAQQIDKTAVLAYLLTLLIILSFIILPTLITQINREYLGPHTIRYALGPGRDFTPAILLAWLAPLAGLLIISLALITLWAWLSRRWSAAFRTLMTLVILASLLIIILGIRWGLFTMLL
jgi:pimeloyl-ACP methyl ester carboxylesterase